MGAAIARALVTNGHEVTVWNRDQSKAPPLSALGATATRDIKTAIEASPLIFICVSDYKASREILGQDGIAEAVSGRTIIRLSTGTPKQARELDRWAKQHGANCLNGDILAWPRQIGTKEATISVSGDASVFHTTQQSLEALAAINYLGDDAGKSAVLFSAVLAYLAGNWIGFCHAALICENEISV